MKEFVEQLLNTLNSGKIDYAVLRNYETFPEKPSDPEYFDIDFLVRRNDHSRYTQIIEAVAKKTGCLIIARYNRQYVKHICVVRFTDNAIKSVFLDAHIDGQGWWGFDYLTEDQILKQKKNYNFFPVICDFHKSLFNWLDKLLWGNYVKKKYEDDIYFTLTNEIQVFREFMEPLLGMQLSSKLIAAIQNHRLDETLLFRKKMIRKIVVSAITQRPFHSFQANIGFFYYEFKLRLFPPGLFCCHNIEDSRLGEIVDLLKNCFINEPLLLEGENCTFLEIAKQYYPQVRKTGMVFLHVEKASWLPAPTIYLDDYHSVVECGKAILDLYNQNCFLGFPNLYLFESRS